MKKNLINKEHIEGIVYDHSLTVKTVKNAESANYGTNFISGSLDIMTDDNFNVVSVHFTYVTPETSKGKKNYTFDALLKILKENKTIIACGQDEAFKVKVDTALGLNDFYSDDGKLISAPRNEGGFVSIVTKIDEDVTKRNTFELDMVITNVRHHEKDDEKVGDEECLYLKGCVFDFRSSVLPVELKICKPEGIEYFEDLEISPSNPVFTKVVGNIVSSTIVIPIEEESAFGGPIIKSVERKTKEWVISSSLKTPYGFGEPSNITAEELTKAMQEREVHLAEVKKRSDEYKAKRNNGGNTPPAPSSSVPSQNIASTIANGAFVF